MKQYLMTKNWILPFPKTKPIKSVFCGHKDQITGLLCSEIGLMRISGADKFKVCNDCGKVLEEHHTQYM